MDSHLHIRPGSVLVFAIMLGSVNLAMRFLGTTLQAHAETAGGDSVVGDLLMAAFG